MVFKRYLTKISVKLFQKALKQISYIFHSSVGLLWSEAGQGTRKKQNEVLKSLT